MIKFPLSVTIDTNIFIENKFDFNIDSTLGVLIKKTRNNEIKLVLSNIVVEEVKKHLHENIDKISKITKQVGKDLRKIFPDQYLKDIGLREYLKKTDKNQLDQNAIDDFKQFLEDCDAEILDTTGLDFEKILEDYFYCRLPFENNENKRKEFPDAIIVQEIRERFPDNEIVAIVSKDNGLKEACGKRGNYMIFDSLGDLYREINESKTPYQKAAEKILKDTNHILKTISEMIAEDCIEVYGLSSDSNGDFYGHDYNEFYINKCEISNIKIHAVEDLDEAWITAFIWVNGIISVDCYFEDFDNSPWDPEKKEYVFIRTSHVLENHNVKFPCRIKLNKETNDMIVLPFKIILGGDSRLSRYTINDEDVDYYQEIEDAEREELGFCSLSKYKDKLEDELIESSMFKKIIKTLNEYNDMFTKFEELADAYDCLYAQISNMKDEDAIEFVNTILTELSIQMDLTNLNIAEVLKTIIEDFIKKSDFFNKFSSQNESVKYFV